MIRRSLVLLAVLAATLVFATPVSAAGATTSTQNFHGAFPPMDVGPLCGVPVGGTLYATGNAVFHVTVNGAGDAWFTSTQEADFTVLTKPGGALVASGHFAIWFGQAINQYNGVAHDTFNIHGTLADGSSLDIHSVFHVNTSASGQINFFMTCSS